MCQKPSLICLKPGAKVPAWTKDDFEKVARFLVQKRHCIASFNEARRVISPSALTSLIEFGFLDYLPCAPAAYQQCSWGEDRMPQNCIIRFSSPILESLCLAQYRNEHLVEQTTTVS